MVNWKSKALNFILIKVTAVAVFLILFIAVGEEASKMAPYLVLCIVIPIVSLKLFLKLTRRKLEISWFTEKNKIITLVFLILFIFALFLFR